MYIYVCKTEGKEMKRNKGYGIEATKGMAQCLGEVAVRLNGKIVRYFMERSEAEKWVQAELAAARDFQMEGR